MSSARSALLSFAFAVALLAALEPDARAQACCVGASGLTPGWLGNHERFLLGAQARVSQTLGTYPASGAFYVPTPGRDSRLETSLFASLRFVERGQVGLLFPLVVDRRRSGEIVETRAGPGDASLNVRYDLVRAGEARVPGIAAIAGLLAPTGTPTDRATGLLAADATGIGAWEFSFGGSVEQTFGHVVLHATALVGVRTARDVLGLSQHLGPRGLFLIAGGYVFDREVTALVSLSHQSEGDATVDGKTSPDTGFRTTQAAVLFVVPVSDAVRLRASLFADVPPLGENRSASAGSTLSILRSWM